MSKEKCVCPKTTCVRHGNCEECVAHHVEIGGVVTCMFPENQGDKSRKAFYEFLKTQFEQ